MENQLIELAYALDTFYFLVMGAFVMWMAAGFTMLESGLVRAKNTAEILTKNISLYSIATIMYMVVGYNLMYPAGGSGFMPDLAFFLGSDNATADVIKSGGEIYYSGISDHFFQVVFVATACSIISGAVAERMKLWPFLLFCVFMTSIIYPVQGYWKWGGGFLDEAGFMDFAGSGVVHLCGAAAALAGVMVLGSRRGKYKDGKPQAMPGANLPLATLGTFILWLGWFGFNGGSVLSADPELTSLTLVTTSIAAAAGGIFAAIVSTIVFKNLDLTMFLNGILGGLVGITAGADQMNPADAVLIGAIAGLLIVAAVSFFDRLKLDDPVGAIAVHLICGIWGTLAVGLFGALASLDQFLSQLTGVASYAIACILVSLLILGTLKVTLGIRVGEKEELEGLDIHEHGMSAYSN